MGFQETFDEDIESIRLAFVVASKFVEVDPSFGHLTPADRRKRLLRSVIAASSQGERDIVRIANRSIALMRKAHVAPAAGNPARSIRGSSLPDRTDHPVLSVVNG